MTHTITHTMNVPHWIWKAWQVLEEVDNPASVIRAALGELTNQRGQGQEEDPIAKSLGAAVPKPNDIGTIISITRCAVCSRCGIFQPVGTDMLIRTISGRNKSLFCIECLKKEKNPLVGKISRSKFTCIDN